MSNRRNFIKKTIIGTAGVAITSLTSNSSFALIKSDTSLSPAMGALADWGYRIGQREVPEVTIKENVADFKVYPNHPRLFFRDTDLATIRQRVKKDFRQEWKEMLDSLDAALNLPASTYAQGQYLKRWTTGRNMAFVAAVTEEEKYILWTKQWAEAMAAAGPVGIDDDYRGRLQSLAVAYDWLYPWLSDAEKQRLQHAILEHIERNWYFAEEEANYVGGHSRWGNGALALGLLSLVNERPELKEKLLIIRDHWINGFHKVQAWIAQDGGYHMGWCYSAPYLSVDNLCVWSSATNECVYYPWQGLIPLFWIYGEHGDGGYPKTGDAYYVEDYDLRRQQDLMVIGAGIFKNSYAAVVDIETTDHFARILYGDKNVKALSPDDRREPLPLSRYFRNAGMVIARDRWDEETTLLQFHSVPFYSANHHHRDENSFTLHYKGPLAIDSGLYDYGGPKGGYGKSHWLNYFTRTVAHNAIVVFDPAQVMTYNDNPISNDGGQTYRREPDQLQDILPGGHAHLDGITHYENTEDYTLAAGDATKAYDPERVKLAQREIVYLRSTARPHPVIVIFDRVESTQPEFEKRFLLHTVNEPVIKDKMTITENNGGRLSCLTILPEQAGLKLIGGPGKEFLVDGKNYPIDGEAFVRPGLEPGAWRLEVTPKHPQTKDYFLHVLFVDDVGAAFVDPALVRLTKNTKSAEITVAGWKVAFSFTPGEKTTVENVV